MVQLSKGTATFYDALICILLTCAAVSAQESDCRRCRTKQADIDCWNQSVTHFTESLTGSLNNFTSDLLYLSRLRSNEPSLVDSLAQFEERIVHDVIARHNVTDAEGPLSAEDLLDIFTFILNKTKPLQEKYKDISEVLPSLTCPAPCDYDSKMYKMLFYIMLVALFLCVLSTVTFMCCVHRQTDFAYVKTFNGQKRNRLM